MIPEKISRSVLLEACQNGDSPSNLGGGEDGATQLDPVISTLSVSPDSARHVLGPSQAFLSQVHLSMRAILSYPTLETYLKVPRRLLLSTVGYIWSVSWRAETSCAGLSRLVRETERRSLAVVYHRNPSIGTAILAISREKLAELSGLRTYRTRTSSRNRDPSADDHHVSTRRGYNLFISVPKFTAQPHAYQITKIKLYLRQKVGNRKYIDHV